MKPDEIQMAINIFNQSFELSAGYRNSGEHPPRLEIDALLNVMEAIHKHNVEVGWWSDPKDPKPGVKTQRNIPEMLALAHTEVMESFEGHRYHRFDDKLPHFKQADVELGDTFIRLADTTAGLFSRELLEIKFHECYIHILTELYEEEGEVLEADYANGHAYIAQATEAFRRKGRDPMYPLLKSICWVFFMFLNVHRPAPGGGVLSLGRVVAEKYSFNLSREDHKVSSRTKEDGLKI